MKYRRFGKLGWEVSALGFGAMRLPQTDMDIAHVDEDEAIRMMRYAFDQGVNYVDTAYFYHGGNSERIVGRALKDGYRQRVKLVTKLPVVMIESPEQFDKIFDEQLERLQVDMVDFYLLHGLNAQGWHKVRDMEVLRWAEKQMARGRIGRLGFSFHDNYEAFTEIVDAYDNWVLAQVQYNFMDVDEQAGRRGVEYAADKGLAVVVMEPLRGGMLAGKPPSAVAGVWEGAHRKQSPVEWALSWVWNQPEISVALSGMSTMRQVVQNVEIAGRAVPGMLDEADLGLIGRVREAYRGLKPIPCSQCNYCMPCPNDVLIPTIFRLYNDAIMYDDAKLGQMVYTAPFGPKEHERADKCIECGDCLEKCPQHIDIPAWLKKAHAALMPEG